MEILTVKNNKMDYSTFKKIIILLFPTMIIRKEQHRQSHKVHHLYHQLHH